MNTTASHHHHHPWDSLGAFALARHNGPFATWQLCISPFCLALLATSQNPLHLYLWIYLTACNLQNQEQEVPRCLGGRGWQLENRQFQNISRQHRGNGLGVHPHPALHPIPALHCTCIHQVPELPMDQAQSRYEALVAF